MSDQEAPAPIDDPAPVAAASQPPEGPSKATTELRTAVIAASVAVIIGLFSGVLSYIVADRTSTSQAQQARADFVRTQRQESYSKVLVDAIELRENIDEVTSLAISRSAEEFGAAYHQWTLGMSAFQADLASAQLVGSLATSRAARDMADLVDRMDTGFAIADPRDGAMVEGGENDLRANNREYRERFDEFIRSARDDQLNG